MLYEVTGSESGINETEIKDVNLNKDSYNGYSVVVGQRDRVSLVFSGAPRSNHSGQVTMFKKMTHKWEAMSNISGEQIGSYFGGSVCVLDLNSDSNTDFLVVGAPLYYKPHPQREGRIYIYRLTQQLKLEKELDICESAQGRFGMTLAAVADLNGDQLQDLAVGAPLEDNQKGAIYIYLGNHEHGIRPNYSQRIAASSISKQLQHFGLAIDGVMDMGQDGLTDIAVGAQGIVLLLKTRPVVSISAKLSFSPSEISLNNFDCLGSSENAFPVIALNTCFSMTENTNSKDTHSLVEFPAGVHSLPLTFSGSALYSQTGTRPCPCFHILPVPDSGQGAIRPAANSPHPADRGKPLACGPPRN
ncbi:hypothetical protein PGIGA_G00165030 [Pangasianodon gigas]|uniref:Uncharacterized protein n=1 Tax=Pangasianodon gigas TaxID=30993 RepID=A0ACC5XRS3_PANGG|nr:hypothetical protein [Pangasianodon gigas]